MMIHSAQPVASRMSSLLIFNIKSQSISKQFTGQDSFVGGSQNVKNWTANLLLLNFNWIKSWRRSFCRLRPSQLHVGRHIARKSNHYQHLEELFRATQEPSRLAGPRQCTLPSPRTRKMLAPMSPPKRLCKPSLERQTHCRAPLYRRHLVSWSITVTPATAVGYDTGD